MSIKNPSNEKWYVEKYATEDNGVGWSNVGDLNEDEQKSLIYFLLSNIGDMAGDNTLSEIIENKPELIEFYRKDILSDPDLIEKLESVTKMWWHLAKEAASDEVDIMVSALKDSFEPKMYLKLLIGADTDYSLSKASEISKDKPGYIKTARAMNLLINSDGTFERRYTSIRYDLFNSENGIDLSEIEGVNLLTESSSAVADGKLPTCNNNAMVVLDADLSLIPSFKDLKCAKTWHYYFFSTNCEECDGWLNSHVLKVNKEKPWEYIGRYKSEYNCEKDSYEGTVLDVDPEDVDCDTISSEPINDEIPKLTFSHAELHKNNTKRIASLGGRPYWVQNEEVPICPECSKMMFYIGQNQTSKWASCIGDQVVYGFICEDCQVAIQIVQFT